MFVFLLFSSLAMATPGSVETKEELSIRLLGAKPSAAVSLVAVAPTGTKLPAVLPTLEPKEAVGAVSLMKNVEAAPAQVELAPEKDVRVANQAARVTAVQPPLAAPMLPTTNADANELLRQQALTWANQDPVEPVVGEEEPATNSLLNSGYFPWWIPAVFFGGIGLFALSRAPGGFSKLAGGNPSSPMRVLSRTALGQSSGLALVEVDTGDGNSRRILVGFGGGSPNLVTELDRPVAERAAEPFSEPIPVAVEETTHIPMVEDFGFQRGLKGMAFADFDQPLKDPVEPVLTTAPPVVKVMPSRRSVLSTKSASLRPSEEDRKGFAAALDQEMDGEAPAKKRTAKEARALVEEVLQERDPKEPRPVNIRGPRPWAGTRFQGTA